jgi:hypothetical protein
MPRVLPHAHARDSFSVSLYPPTPTRKTPLSDREQNKLSGDHLAQSPLYGDYFQTRLLKLISRFARTLPLHSKFFAFDP